MLYKLAFSALFNNPETKVMQLLVSVEASIAASVFPPRPIFSLHGSHSLGVLCYLCSKGAVTTPLSLAD